MLGATGTPLDPAFSWAAVAELALLWLRIERPAGEVVWAALAAGAVSLLIAAIAARSLVAIGRGGVASIVRRSCVRAGIAEVGTHRLRHTMACEMVRMGVPLPEIGQVLRHRSLTSTAIYARVDLDHLRQLAQPWPLGRTHE